MAGAARTGVLGLVVGLAACTGDAGLVYESDCIPPSSPERLSETCLYQDADAHEVAADVQVFEAAYPLWSDGAKKTRWIRFPAGTQIDTSDMDHWDFPVGTQVWKEFSRDGILLETRLIQRLSETEYWMGAFLWRADGSDAVFVPDGQDNALGTTHDVPAAEACNSCHDGEPGRILGFSAVQLSGNGPIGVESLAAEGRLSHPPPTGSSFLAPGDQVTSAALGYLHGNCGHCHNHNGPAFDSGFTCPGCTEGVGMILRLSISAETPEATDTYASAVGIATQAMFSRNAFRVEPGRPEQSEIVFRARQRDAGSGGPGPFQAQQMPPLATEVTDEAGIDALVAWIEALPDPESR